MADKLTHADKDQIIAGLKQQIVTLESRVRELEAVASAAPSVDEAPAPAPAGDGFEPLGQLNSRGLFFIGDSAFAEGWKNENTQSAWCVDFTGFKAEYFARGQSAHRVVELEDGTWRVIVPNRQYAAIVQDQAKKRVLREGWDTQISCYPKNSSRTQALDAARGTGFGFVHGALALRHDQAVSVEAKKVDGALTEIRLKL